LTADNPDDNSLTFNTDAMNRKILILLTFITITFSTCSTMEKADIIFINARIYAVDSVFSIHEAMALKNGKILYAGSNAEVQKKYSSANVTDLAGQYVYPGFIDAHCHFVGYGLSLDEVDLRGTSSFEEILERVKAYATENTEGWISGRGWDQNDWKIKEFPTRKELDLLYPERPVILYRIDGHAALANAKALEIAGVSLSAKVEGGEFRKEKGQLTGILVDNAIEYVRKHIPPPSERKLRNGILAAQKNCFSVGLTSVHDAGLDASVIQLLDSMHSQGDLKMRVYAMLNPGEANIETFMKKGPYKTDYLNVRSLKLYADGALGSRGALLLAPYTDALNTSGLFVMHPDFIAEMSELASQNNYQVCTHCIGDSAVRTVLNIYEKTLKGKNDKRWRIEHAQIVHPADFEKFGGNSIIPSIQTTHATSDMYWAEGRLGPRIANAYPYARLLAQNGWLPNGSDFPVEDINPVYGFYAAVARKDHKGFPENGFEKKDALSRQDALRAMTIWAAKAAFEEYEKGSLEAGKFADFVILNRDIMSVSEEEIIKARVTSTWISGQEVFTSYR
jgi:predicted amidohydrolase YtcJ